MKTKKPSVKIKVNSKDKEIIKIAKEFEANLKKGLKGLGIKINTIKKRKSNEK